MIRKKPFTGAGAEPAFFFATGMSDLLVNVVHRRTVGIDRELFVFAVNLSVERWFGFVLITIPF
jgi:hypothetical protein